MENSKEKLGRAKVLYAEATEILTNPEAPIEEKERVEQLVKEAQDLQKDAAQLQRIGEASAEMAAFVEHETKQKEVEEKQVVKGEEFKTLGDLLTGIKAWSMGLYKDPRLAWYDDVTGKRVEAKTLVESVGASGGFLVPTEFLANLQSIRDEMNFVRPRATIIPMRRRQINIPVLDQTGTTAGQPHWFGGMQFTWTEEATAKTLSEPDFRQIELVAHKLIGYSRVSDELLDDSAISLAAFLSGPMGMAGGAAWEEEWAFLQGTGAGQPLGVINAGATITVPRAAQLAISFADLANMMENFLPGGDGVWVITQSAMADIIQLAGPAGNPSFIWQPNARDGVPGFLLGFPVIWSEKVPRIGTAGDVVLADWQYYLIGDRQAVTIESTTFDRWRYDETSWRMVLRVDGQPWLSAPLRYDDGTTEVSPFVILGDKTT